jgi:hypothetical protein
LYRHVFAKRNATRIPDAPQHGLMIHIRIARQKLQDVLYPISQSKSWTAGSWSAHGATGFDRPLRQSRNAQLLDGAADEMTDWIFVNRLSPVK